jgi:hypothetical protein
MRRERQEGCWCCSREGAAVESAVGQECRCRGSSVGCRITAVEVAVFCCESSRRIAAVEGAVITEGLLVK